MDGVLRVPGIIAQPPPGDQWCCPTTMELVEGEVAPPWKDPRFDELRVRMGVR
jgi:hypothetical protein